MQCFIALVSLMCLFFVNLVQAQDGNSSSNPVSQFPSAEFNPAAWKTYVFPEGFSVLLPDKPVRTPASDEAKNKLTETHHYFLQTKIVSYLLVHTKGKTDLENPAVSKMTLQNARDFSVANVKGKVLEEREIFLEEHPGLELKVGIEGGYIRSKFFLVGTAMYQVIGMVRQDQNTSNEIIKMQEGAVAKLLDSFKLTKPEAATTSQTTSSSPDETTSKKQSDSSSKKTEPASCQSVEGVKAGDVKVEVTISEQGDVIEAKAVDGPRHLYKCAEDTLRQWKFKPVLKDGAAVRVQGFMTVKFEGN